MLKNFDQCSPQGPGYYVIMSRDFVYIPLKIALYNLEEIRIVHPNHYETEYSILCSPQVLGCHACSNLGLVIA